MITRVTSQPAARRPEAKSHQKSETSSKQTSQESEGISAQPQLLQTSSAQPLPDGAFSQRAKEPARFSSQVQAKASLLAPAAPLILQAKWQARGSGEGSAAQSLAETARSGLSGPGNSLPYLSQIQRSFGRHDVSGVVSHSDSAAKSATKELGAVAYAQGQHVAFGSQPTLHTAAHEAAHTIQQQAGVHLAGGVGREGDPHERHADAVADRVVQGLSSESLLDSYTGPAPATQAKGEPDSVIQFVKGANPDEDRRNILRAHIKLSFAQEDKIAAEAALGVGVGLLFADIFSFGIATVGTVPARIAKTLAGLAHRTIRMTQSGLMFEKIKSLSSEQLVTLCSAVRNYNRNKSNFDDIAGLLSVAKQQAPSGEQVKNQVVAGLQQAAQFALSQGFVDYAQDTIADLIGDMVPIGDLFVSGMKMARIEDEIDRQKKELA